MKLDGVDFWATNRHIMMIWDEFDEAGPYIIMIDDKIRIGRQFNILIQSSDYGFYRIVQRQCDRIHQAYLKINVEDPKTSQDMYQILLRVRLTNIKLDEGSDEEDMYLTYELLEAIDKTNYENIQ